MEIINEFTEDGLKLPIIHFESKNKNICVICVHGMSSNILESIYGQILGISLPKSGIGFIYGHTRGHSHLNDIECRDGSFKRIGTTYEIFDDCLYDIDLFVSKAKELGYKKIILLGHSLGCNKVIYYMYNEYLKGRTEIMGIILASAPDQKGKLQMCINEKYDELLNEAKYNIDNSNPTKLLSEEIYDRYISSETFLSFYSENSSCNNLPIIDKKEVFEQFSIIDVPILTFSGSEEHSTYLNLDYLKTKATNCPNFSSKIIEGTGHMYLKKEEEIASLIIAWINSMFAA